ncbi:hypothetical protein GCK72_003101 [Caenorhabditis remanei]|uniref:SET domain-containing protein n=1 Tax=Caenorhabditis remanei TaxID=31234 RepID=A0A6A5HUI8_CAERE|nr:hypothetical protein GCK72_003101 [Caenorhabditis remanei]KAF1771275.1 hypothetical protein GCK72_003101 [Caenorhabditis remanei]
MALHYWDLLDVLIPGWTFKDIKQATEAMQFLGEKDEDTFAQWIQKKAYVLTETKAGDTIQRQRCRTLTAATRMGYAAKMGVCLNSNALLAKLEQTNDDADAVLHDLRLHRNACRMFVDTGEEALIASKFVPAGGVILEMNGLVALQTELVRPAGGGKFMFRYDGLSSKRRDAICIDTEKLGIDSKFTRRSCNPNSVLKRILGSESTLGIMMVATKTIKRNDEVTLPFDSDWKDSMVPLKCVKHTSDNSVCPLERSCLESVENIEREESNGSEICEKMTCRDNNISEQPTKKLSQHRPKSKNVPTPSASGAASTDTFVSKAQTLRRLRNHRQLKSLKTPTTTTTARRNIKKCEFSPGIF